MGQLQEMHYKCGLGDLCRYGDGMEQINEMKVLEILRKKSKQRYFGENQGNV